MKFLYPFLVLFCLNTSVAQNIKTLNKGKVIQKNYNTNVPYKDIKGLIVVEVIIKGKTYNFIVDTGAISLISPQLYEELGLKSSSEVNVSDSSDLNQQMKLTTLPPVQVGDITFENVPAVVSENIYFMQCLGVDGFIGSNMLRNCVVKFSYKDKTVSFTDKRKNFDTYKKNRTDLLKDKFQSNPYLYIYLKNNDIIAREYLLFDTGMIGLYDLSLTAYDTFRKFNVFSVLHQAKGAYSVGIHGVENQKEHSMLLLPKLNFAGTIFKNITTTTTSDKKSRIGSQILQYGDVIIDYPHRHLYFNPYTNGEVDLTEKNWPIQPVIKEDKLIVGLVWDSQFNGRINEGDEIIKFGEIDYSNLDPCEAFRLNLKPKADTAIITLRDKESGKIKNVSLTKK
ncbi:retropepsin-like aspartic protease [Flavobacterium rakeshii]|uniref:retropepsin-like aspartic protease n=1 Tax=Flavobacterium rakeshii TaxID=1038845 RepID=UPI002E7C11AA|nr:retropepsin-like aspartic protease [Flavobacterium rakeshii]MEE1896712.1 retropepsin-like aspartic protease [Flavobacterium rakeshii]